MDRVCSGRMKSWMLSMGMVATLAASSAAPLAFAQSQEAIDERASGVSPTLTTSCMKRLSITGGTAARADHERRELREAREQYWREHHRWWDEHERRWHEERDWADRDHDRD